MTIRAMDYCVVVLVTLVVMQFKLASAARIEKVNGELVGAQPFLYIFGSQPTDLVIQTSDNSTQTQLRVSSTPVTMCDASSSVLFTLPPGREHNLTLSAASLPFTPVPGNDYWLCYGLGDLADYSLRVLPVLRGGFQGSFHPIFYAPMGSVAGQWEVSLSFFYDMFGGDVIQELSSSSVTVVDDSVPCSAHNSVFTMAVDQSNVVASLTSADVTTTDSVDSYRVCVYGSPTQLTIVPVKSISAGGAVVAVASSATVIPVPISVTLSRRVRAELANGTVPPWEAMHYDLSTCDFSAGHSWGFVATGDTFTVTPTSSASGQQATVCMFLSGLSLKLSFELFALDIAAIDHVSVGTNVLPGVVSHIFDTPSTSAATLTNANHFTRWNVSLRDGALLTTTMSVVMKPTADCSGASHNTDEGSITPDAHGAVLSFPASWNAPPQSTQYLCLVDGPQSFRIPGFAVAVLSATPDAVSGVATALHGETASLRLSSLSVPSGAEYVVGSVPCYSSRLSDATTGAVPLLNRVAAGASTMSVSFEFPTAAMKNGFHGKLCVEFLNDDMHAVARGSVSEVVVIAATSVGENDAHAVFHDTTTFLLSASIPSQWLASPASYPSVVFFPHCLGAGLPLSGAVGSTSITMDGAHSNFRLCWGLRSVGSSTVRTRRFLADIQVVARPVQLTTSRRLPATLSATSWFLDAQGTTGPVTDFHTGVSLALVAGAACGNGVVTEATAPPGNSHDAFAGWVTSSGPAGTYSLCAGILPRSGPKTAASTASHSLKVGTIVTHEVIVQGISSRDLRQALMFPVTNDFVPDSATRPYTFALSPAIPPFPPTTDSSVFWYVSDSAERWACSAPAPGGVEGPVVGPAIAMALQRVSSLPGQRATLCVAIGSATDRVFAPALQIVGFSVKTIDGEPVFFGAGALFARVGFSVLAESERTATVIGTNLQFAAWTLRLFANPVALCADAASAGAEVPMIVFPDGTEGRFTIPSNITFEARSVCLVAVGTGETFATRLNMYFVNLPFSAFDTARSDRKQSTDVVTAKGIRTYTRVLKAATAFAGPVGTANIDFVFVRDSSVSCSTATPTDVVSLDRVVDSSSHITIETSVPPQIAEGTYRLCAKRYLNTTALEFLALGTSLVVLDLRFSGLTPGRAGTLMALRGTGFNVHIASASSELLEKARVMLKISDSTCEAAVSDGSALQVGIPRNAVVATGCAATGYFAAFQAGHTSSITLGTTQNLCISLSSAGSPSVSETGQRFASTSIKIVVADQQQVTLGMTMETDVPPTVAGNAPLTPQPVLALIDTQSGNRFSSLPFEVIVDADWVVTERNALLGEAYSATFAEGAQYADFSSPGVSKIHLYGSLYALAYHLSFVFRSTVELPPLNSSATQREPCLSSTLLAVPFTAICQECPATSVCDGSPSLRVDGSFWRPSNTSLAIQSCEEPHGSSACVSGTETGTCLEGHYGPLCTSCESGYAKASPTGRCVKCPAKGESGFIVFLSILVVVIVVSIVIDSTLRCRKGDQFPTYVKLTVNHITVAAVIGDMSRYYPDYVRDFFHIEKQLSQPSPGFASFDCATGATWYDKFVVINVLPAVLAVAMVPLVGLYFVLTRGGGDGTDSKKDDGKVHPYVEEGPKLERRRLSFSHVYSVVMVAITFVFYPTLVQWAANAHGCEDMEVAVSEGSQETTVKSLFFFDRQIDCDSSKHQQYQSAAIFFILLWGLGIPVAYLLSYIMTARKQHHSSASRALAFVVCGYRREVWWWEFMILLRKFLFIVVVSYVRDSQLQCLLCSWVIALGFFAHEKFQPCEYTTVDLMEKISMAVLFITLSMLLLLDLVTGDATRGTVSDGGTAVGIVILLLNILVLAWMLLHVVPEGVRKLRKQLHRKRHNIRRVFPPFLANLILALSLSDIIIINVVDPSGNVTPLPKIEDDLVSDWSDIDDADVDIPGVRVPGSKAGKKGKPAGGVADELDDDAGGTKPSRKSTTQEKKQALEIANALKPIAELPDDPNRPQDQDADHAKMSDLFNKGCGSMPKGKRTALAAGVPLDEDIDPSLLEDARSQKERDNLKIAFMKGRVAQQAGNLVPEVEEIEPDDGKRKLLRRAYDLGNHRPHGAHVPDEPIPEELDDTASGLSDDEIKQRRKMQVAYSRARVAQQAHDELDELVHDEGNKDKKQRIEDAFEQGKKASAGGAIPTELDDEQPDLDEAERADRKKQKLAFLAGRKAQTPAAVAEEAEPDDLPEEDLRKATELGRRSAQQEAARRSAKQPGAASLEELLEDPDVPMDPVERKRMHVRMHAMCEQGRQARQAQDAVDELVEDDTLTAPQRTALKTAFASGKGAQKRAEDASIPEELREEPAAAVTEDDRRERKAKRVAFLSGRHASRLSGGVAELSEEPEPEGEDEGADDAQRQQDAVASLRKQMMKNSQQVEEQLQTIRKLLDQLALAEAENTRLKEEQKSHTMQSSMTQEMAAMAETITSLQDELRRARAQRENPMLLKTKLMAWKKTSKVRSDERDKSVEAIMQEAKASAANQDRIAQEQKKAQQDALQAKLAAKKRKKGAGDTEKDSASAKLVEDVLKGKDADVSEVDALKNAFAAVAEANEEASDKSVAAAATVAELTAQVDALKAKIATDGAAWDAREHQLLEEKAALARQGEGSGDQGASDEQKAKKEKTKKWSAVARLVQYDPAASIVAICAGSATQRTSSDMAEKFSARVDALVAGGAATTADDAAALQESFDAVRSLVETVNNDREAVADDLARQKKLVKMLMKQIPRNKATEVVQREEQDKAKAVLEEAERKSAERAALEVREKEAQQALIEERIRAKRKKREAKGAPKKSTSPIPQEDPATKPLDVEDSTAAKEVGDALSMDLTTVVQDPQQARQVVEDLREIIAALQSHSGGLAERYSSVLEQLASEAELNTALVSNMDDTTTKHGDTKANTATEKEDLEAAQKLVSELTTERDELRSKLDALGSTKSALKRVGNVKERVKAWKIGADARKQERKGDVETLQKDAAAEQAAKDRLLEDERQQQQDLIRAKLERKRKAFKAKKAAAAPAATEEGQQPAATAEGAAESATETAAERAECDAILARMDVTDSISSVASFADEKEEIANLRGVVEGLQSYTAELKDKYATATAESETAKREVETSKATLDKFDEAMKSSDMSVQRLTDEMALLAATLHDLEAENTSLKGGVLDTKTGATAAVILEEVDYLKRRVAMLEAETGHTSSFNKDLALKGQSADDVKGKLVMWTKNAKKSKKKRDGKLSELMSDAKSQEMRRAAHEEADHDAQKSVLEEKLAAKRRKRAAKKGQSEPTPDGAVAVEVAPEDDEKKKKEESVSGPTQVVDANGQVLVQARRHMKLRETAAMSVLLSRKRHADPNVAATDGSSSSDSDDE